MSSAGTFGRCSTSCERRRRGSRAVHCGYREEPEGRRGDPGDAAVAFGQGAVLTEAPKAFATRPCTPTELDKPIIFISYAHADEPEKPAEGEVRWLAFVTGYQRPASTWGAVACTPNLNKSIAN